MQKGLGRDILSNIPNPMSVDVWDCEGNERQQAASLCAVSKIASANATTGKRMWG